MHEFFGWLFVFAALNAVLWLICRKPDDDLAGAMDGMVFAALNFLFFLAAISRIAVHLLLKI